MELKNLSKPTTENLLFYGVLGIAALLMYQHQISQNIGIVIGTILAILFAKSTGTKQPISKREAQKIVEKEVELMQARRELPAGTAILDTEATLDDTKEKYLVGVKISQLGAVRTYVFKISQYGVIVGHGRKKGGFSALEEKKADLSKELKVEEKKPDSKISTENQTEDVNSGT